MIYNETYIATATTTGELVATLSTLPADTCVDVATDEHKADVEVWYDKDVNTVILK